MFKLITFSNNISTIGNWYDGDELICCTLERPWLKNKVNVSCIPGGFYTIRPVKSPKFGDTFEVCNVLGRTHILIHKGNHIHETQGCIMPVSKYGVLQGKFTGLSSGKAYDKLMGVLGSSEHKLEIKRY